MKNILKSIIFTGLTFLGYEYYSQCSRPSNSTSNDFSTITSSWKTRTGNTNTRIDFYAYSGEEYVFSLCSADGGVCSFDSQITIRDYFSPYTYRAYNDDNCSLASKITWTAPSSGYYDLYVNEYDCSSTTSETFTVAYKKTTTNYTITYNNNSGSGSMTSTTGPVPLTVSSNTFTRDCYTFNGWNTASDGSGTAYANGASYSTAANVTLYAQWSAATVMSSASWTSGDGAFTACVNNASAHEEFTINACNLSGDLTATAPAGFEISIDAGVSKTYTSSLVVPQSQAESGQIIYVRMTSAASDPTTANLSISGGGLSSPTTTQLSGSFTQIPSTPGTITPSSNPTCSGASTTYTISAVTGATSYNWTFSGTGTPSGASTTGTLSPTSTGNIGVTAANSCGTSGQATLAVTLTPSTLYVDPSGTDAAGYGTSSGSNAFATLSYAVSSVCTNVATTINVAAGTYTDESINITSSNLTINGAGATTIFDGDLDGRFLIVNASNFTLSNMKVKEYGSTNSGGAIYVYGDNTPISFNNIDFSSNSSTEDGDSNGGGAVYLALGSSTRSISFTGCTFTTNTSTQEGGGAIYSKSSATSNQTTLNLTNCIFGGNTAPDYGGAIEFDFTTATINNCLFYENQCNTGAAINSWNSAVTAFNCTFADNVGTAGAHRTSTSSSDSYTNTIFYGTVDGSGVSEEHIYVKSGATMTQNFTICENCGTQSFGATVTNEVTGNPNFNDAANDDYSLQTPSPAVDAGTPTGAPATDINGLSRPQGSADDLGCYELLINTWVGGIAGNQTVWSNAGNWSTGSIPGSSDPVIIADVAYNPVLDATDQVGSITIQNGGVLTINSSVTLTASSVELQSGGDLVISNGELNCTGKFDHDGDLTMSGSGVLDIDGEYESSASATEIISGGTIEVAGEWDGALDDEFTPTGGTVTMNGSSDKNLAQHANSNFYNLTIANSGGDVDVTAALDIDGDLTINASADLDIGGGNANLELAGSFINNGTFTTSGESITFDGAAGDKTCSAISDVDLDIVVNKTSTGKVTFAGTCSFDEVTVTDGIFAITSNTLTADNTVSIADDAELEIGTGTFNADGAINANTTGEIDFTGDGKLILSSSVTSLGALDDADGTVEYDGGAQNVISDTYNKLSIKSSGTKTAAGNITVNGDLTTENTSGCIFDIDTRELTAKGGITVGYRGGLDLKDGTLNISGSSAQSFTSPGSYTDGSQVVISTQTPGSNSDDGYEYQSGSASSTIYTTNDYLRVGDRGGASSTWAEDISTAIRFPTIPVPQGATIVSATLKLTAEETNSDWVELKIYAEDVDDASTIGSSSNEIENYIKTTAAVDWDFTGISDNTEYTSSDIKTVIQEIVDRSGWSSDNDIKLILMDDQSSSHDEHYRFHAYDEGVPSYYPKLDITYTTISNSIPRSKNITITNSAGMTLSQDLQIEGTLNLNGGSINTNGNTVHVTSTGSVGGSKGTSPCNCIYPNAYTQELTTTSEVEFRTGNSGGTERKSIWVQPENANSVTFSADFIDNVHTDASDCGTGLDHISSASYYDVSRTAGTENAKVKIGWYTNDQVDDYASLLLAHYDGSQWQEVASTPSGSNTSGTIISNGFESSFSPFALGSSNSGNALPIDLLSFGGECENGRVQLEFVVASQVNNDYFTIERSVDGNEWSEVGIIEGEGNTSTQMTYRWIDDSPMNGVNYYRLSQTDYDGTSETFAPVAITCETAPTDGYSVYPNPANEVLNIDLELENHQGDDVSIEVLDINSKIIQSKSVQLNRGFNHLELYINDIPSGVYMINFVGTRDYFKEARVVKQ